MEVILLKKVANLGELGDKVAVRPGYGRNYLVPQGYAVSATEENLKAFEARRTFIGQNPHQNLLSIERPYGNHIKNR